jgi:general stress protein 26
MEAAMPDTARHPSEVLSDLISDIGFAMLTTTNRDGRLCSRPMSTQKRPFDGDLWFLTDRRTHTAEDIALHPQVNVAYASISDHRYVSVSGPASLVEDREMINDLWHPAYGVWFPVGPSDPNLVLLRIRAEQADYWDSPSTWAGRFLAFAKALATGDKSSIGSRGHIDLVHGAGAG